MKEQHKDMMRRLKGGEFDARAFPSKEQAAPVTELVEEVAITEPPAAYAASHPSRFGGVDLLFQETVQTAPPAQPAAPQPPAAPKKEQAVSLDDAILNFFGASK